MKKITLRSVEDTIDFAKSVGPELCGKSIALIGPLGAGKTTFVRALVAHFGSTDHVSSPTFVLQHEYLLPSGGKVEHWDLFRLQTTPEELELPVSERDVRIVEWAERASGIAFDLRFHFTLVGEERVIEYGEPEAKPG
jgi:tRNA threonylcarbamoyladenosine biosynthesis protein TsaE